MAWNPPQRQARRFVLASCGYRFLWGITVAGVLVGVPALSIVAFIGAFPLVFLALGIGYQIEDGVTEGNLFSYALGWGPGLSGGRRGYRRQRNLMRPTFYRDVARASKWPVGRVLATQAALLIADLVLFVVLILSPPS